MTEAVVREAQSLVPPSREIRSLTGIRGVAAFYVVFHHYFQGTPGLRNFVYTFRGYLSVDLFFVLSGFVLALTYRRQLAKGPFDRRAYGEFIFRRLARIYPVYFVVLVVILGLIASGLLNPVPVQDVVANVLLVQAWGLAPSINGPGWSISTEFGAYLGFPFVAWLVLKRSGSTVAAIGLLATGFLWFVATRTDAQNFFAFRQGPLDVYMPGVPYPMLRCLGGFILGVVAFRLAGSAVVKRVLGWRGMADALLLIVIGAWGFPALDVLTVLLFVPLVIALTQERSVASRVLGWGFVYHLGVISYSLYLVHGPFGAVFRAPLERFLVGLHIVKVSSLSGLLLLPPLILLSMACFYGIERPARDAARRMFRQRSGA